MRSDSLLLLCLLALGAAPRAEAARNKALIEFKVDSFSSEDAELKDSQEKLRSLEKKIKNGEIPPIEFEFNKATLLESSKTALRHVADLLLGHPHMRLTVAGHTCDIGGANANMRLSQRRANAVQGELARFGVPVEHIRARGYGSTHPLYSNDNEEHRAKNRRVELFITKRTWDSIY